MLRGELLNLLSVLGAQLLKFLVSLDLERVFGFSHILYLFISRNQRLIMFLLQLLDCSLQSPNLLISLTDTFRQNLELVTHLLELLEFIRLLRSTFMQFRELSFEVVALRS